MAGFELQTSNLCIRSNHSTNWATTCYPFFIVELIGFLFSYNYYNEIYFLKAWIVSTQMHWRVKDFVKLVKAQLSVNIFKWQNNSLRWLVDRLVLPVLSLPILPFSNNNESTFSSIVVKEANSFLFCHCVANFYLLSIPLYQETIIKGIFNVLWWFHYFQWNNTIEILYRKTSLLWCGENKWMPIIVSLSAIKATCNILAINTFSLKLKKDTKMKLSVSKSFRFCLQNMGEIFNSFQAHLIAVGSPMILEFANCSIL